MIIFNQTRYEAETICFSKNRLKQRKLNDLKWLIIDSYAI